MDQLTSSQDARKTVIANELAWHELEGHRRFSLDAFLYAPPVFDPLVQSSFDYLHMKTGELVLDMGCGEGKETLQLAQQRMVVISVDLSHLQLTRARELVKKFAPDAQVCFVQANAEQLPFAPGSFRTIYGKAILHHLDIGLSAREVKRLLIDRGRATFAEPMACHPLFWLGRQLTPQLRTKDEHPLKFKELRHFVANFNQVEIEEYFLLAPLSYGIRMIPGGEPIFRRVHAVLQKIDRWLWRILPFLREWAWYGLVKIEK